MTTLSNQQSDAVRAAADWYAQNQPSFRDEQRSVIGDDGNVESRIIRVVDRQDGALPEHTPTFNMNGFAGTGKSTILPFIVEATGLRPDQITFCAPTGKAAKVMTEKLKAQGLDVVARTIHSTIYKPSQVAIETIERELRLWEAAVDNLSRGKNSFATMPNGMQPSVQEAMAMVRLTKKKLQDIYSKDDISFLLNPDSEARGSSLIVVDECSMVGMLLASDILSYGVPVLAIGDPGQLPPIKDKWGLIKRQPDAMLTEIHRQAADNPIIALSKQIREGRVPSYGSMGDAVRVIPSYKDDATYDMTRDAQVIVGTHRKRSLIINQMRRKMGFTSNGPVEGDQLIITRNSRQHEHLVNGSFVVCAESIGDIGDRDFEKTIPLETANGPIRLNCSLHELRGHDSRLSKADADATDSTKRRLYDARQNNHHIDFGWAITCHKAQGSQWENTIVHDESAVFRQDARRWLYTACTRASETLVLVR